MATPQLLLLVQLGTTLPLVGLIWFVQQVAYPLFARVGASHFAAYHGAHTSLITYVVAPLMLGELASAVAWCIWPLDGVPRQVAWIGAALAATTWAVTLLASVPQHEILARGFDPRAHELLVATNWLRTVAWTARGALLLWVSARVLGTRA